MGVGSFILPLETLISLNKKAISQSTLLMHTS